MTRFRPDDEEQLNVSEECMHHLAQRHRAKEHFVRYTAQRQKVMEAKYDLSSQSFFNRIHYTEEVFLLIQFMAC